MAITLIAATITGFTAAIGTAAVFSWAAFAISAGFSLVARALTPKPDLGAQMGGQSVTTRDAAQSRKIIYGRARVGGNIVYLESTGTDNKYLWLVIAVAGHEIDAYESVWFNDDKIWGSSQGYYNNWGNVVSISFYKGDQTAADSGLVAASNKWTTNHKLLDTAYMVVKMTHDVDKFSSGLPNISTIVRGKKVLNPSDNSTAWSQNPALCIYDYLRDTKYGLNETAANILTASVNTAKTICDQSITLADDTTQARYTIDGVIDTGATIKSNIELMIGSMAGRLIYASGQFEIHAGSYVAPAFTVDESQIVGDITVQTKQSRRSAYNGVKGVFLSEEDNYILADYPAQISSAYAVQDGDPIYLDMALPFTTNNVRAQRLAKLALFRSRQQEAITIPCNLSALRFKIGDNINVTNARLGYNQKVFEVVGYSMGFSAGGTMGVDVQAIETAASIWNWAASDEEVFLGGGEVALYNGAVSKPPTNVQVASDSFLADDGTFNTAFKVSWTNADDAFTDRYLVEWKLTSVSEYFSTTTKSTPAIINNLQNGEVYNVRVTAINELGVSSTPVSPSNPTAAVDTTAPSVPSSVSASGEFEQITIAWTNPTVDDFSHVDVYGSNSSGSGFALIGKSAGTSFIETDLAVGVTRYYKLKSIDYTGNASAFSGVVNALTTQVPVGGIADNAVDTAQIADLAVETAQIDNDAVTIAKVATSLQSTNYSSGSAGWKILKSGVVEFEQATIRGEITASTGVIGGFTVGSTSLIAGANATRVSLSTADGIHLGHNTFGSAPFRVNRAGALTATSATITGALTLTNVDGSTVVYSGGNLQVGTVQTANIANDAVNNAKIAVDAIQGDVIAAGAIVTAKLGVDAVTSAKIADNAVLTAAINDDAITNALIATDAVNGDSIAANSVTASSIVAGTITASEIAASTITASKIAANTITATQIAADAITANEIAANAVTADAIAANSVTASEIAANTITASQIAANAVTATEINVANLAAISANMGTITAGSISSALITGDVTEVYPIGQYYYTALTSSVATLGSFTIPAPTSGILKRQKIDINVLFLIVNSAQTPIAQAAIVFTVEKKSKGVNAVSVGSVTVESESIAYNQLLSISGNVLDKVDVSGGVAASADASGTNEPAYIQAVFYDSGANKTYIQCSAYTDLFSNGNTMYFSDSKFTSAGTWVTPTTTETIYVPTPPDPSSGVGNLSVYLPFKMSYGQTTTLTDYRVRSHVSNAQSGVTYTARRMVGTLENIS
jgi:hypothetical protein